jgi:hypothetical protein
VTILSRRGGLLVEMIVALSMGAALLTALATFVTSSVRWHRAIASRAEGLEVARTVWAVLEEELGPARRGRDWILDSAGVLDLRAFRAFGRVCPGAGGAGLTVAFRGERLPEAVRDSVLVLLEDGTWTTAPVASVGATSSPPGCLIRPGESALSVVGPLEVGPAPVLLRFFERGSYHLADLSFRYRRGGGGRQPLTAERIGPGSGFSVEGDSLEVTLDVLSLDSGSAKSFIWRAGERGRSP